MKNADDNTGSVDFFSLRYIFHLHLTAVNLHTEPTKPQPVSINAKSPLPSGLTPEGKDLTTIALYDVLLLDLDGCACVGQLLLHTFGIFF